MEIPKIWKGFPVFFSKSVSDYGVGHSRRNIKGFEMDIPNWKYRENEDSFPHPECKIACDGLCPYLYYDASKEPDCCPHGICLYKGETGSAPNWLKAIIKEIF